MQLETSSRNRLEELQMQLEDNHCMLSQVHGQNWKN